MWRDRPRRIARHAIEQKDQIDNIGGDMLTNRQW
jgi:hypothetical protein